MKPFLDENFLLHSETAVQLYHEHAKTMPIFDYHCHLSPADLAHNRQYRNLTQLCLEGDHYKWRAMRASGISEQYITGDASDREKFDAWVSVVERCIGNPLLHWAHLELRRFFNIDLIINSKNANEIWDKTQVLLENDEFSSHALLERMNVAFVGTTDDPCDSLEHHQYLKDESKLATTVSPSWRPDRAFKIADDNFVSYIARLSEVSSVSINSYEELQAALTLRMDHFQSLGCLSADHGIEVVEFALGASVEDLNSILVRRLKGESLTQIECHQFSTALQVWLAHCYRRRNWVMQMHIGAQRNNNTKMFNMLGRDSGFDSISDRPYSYELSRLLDTMEREGGLPKTILYTLNPSANEMIATMIGNFQDGEIPGKIQFGSAWWFNDQKDGMERQIEQLAQLGLLNQFVGMLTDSRSVLSFIRHEYFRRILCEKVGQWVENGEFPPSFDLLGDIVRDICYNNAKRYFNG